MLSFVTGLPGAGKTQMVIEQLLKKACPVFYSNIPFKFVPVGWQEFEPKNWAELPAGSVFLVDEAQDFFPVGSLAVPDWVQALSKHRHKGLDGYFITQAPTLVHSFVRKLCGEWLDVVRIFGRNASTVYRRSKVDADAPIHGTSVYKYNREIWWLYKSATIHTKHGRIPLKAYMVILLALVFIGGTVYVGARTYSSIHSHGLTPGSASPAALTSQSVTKPTGIINTVQASEGHGCGVLMGFVANASRVLLSFEYPDGTWYQAAVLPAQLKTDRLLVDGCSYYIGAGSLRTDDAVARAAVAARKQIDSNQPDAAQAASDKTAGSNNFLRSGDTPTAQEPAAPPPLGRPLLLRRPGGA